MQCNQPLFYSGSQNNDQFPPYPTQPYYPDIIGEGDVMTYTLPDGTIQCYFVPINRRDRWVPPHFTSSYYMPTNLPSTKEAWFVRSILNTYPAAGLAGLNQLSNNCGESFLRPNVNSWNYGFVQKFHNDGWTSTTDLHYFYPSLRRDWNRGCAGIQVEIPSTEKTIYHYGTVCNRPCYCNQPSGIPKVESNCVESDCTETPMCVDEVKSSHSCCVDSKKEKKCAKNKSKSCACSRVNTADKVVTTYADQGISCTDTKEHGQAAGKHSVFERTDIETEVWYPRRRKCKKHHAHCSRDASDSACSDDEQLEHK